MKKLILFSVIVLMLVSVVSADQVISNIEGINVSLGSIYAGSTFGANFSFNYFGAPQNEDGSPLIIQLNVTSNDGSYPVNKNEFEITGTIKKYYFFGMIPGDEIDFECNETENQVIEHPKDAASVEAPNGTFYCYNEDGDLDLNEHDQIYLTIKSHPAIYPGQYDLSAKLFYLTDERSPFVNITNKDAFDLYYREIDNVEILANISDGSDISNKWSMAFLGYDNLTFPFSYDAAGIYHFSGNTPVDIVEGDYPLYVFAEDEYDNEGNDSVVLKIDRTAPDIVLIQPDGSVYEDLLPIEMSVADSKAGLNESEVYYRLREMNGSSVCPESGSGTWICYNSGWLPLPNTSGDLFGTVVNTTEVGLNGEYWLDIRAYDILGNEGVLE